MVKNWLDRWELVGRACENCGRPIPEPAPHNFAHPKSRNLSTREEIETVFFVVCFELHDFEHRRAKNLALVFCVAIFLDDLDARRAADPRAPFWPALLRRSPRAD